MITDKEAMRMRDALEKRLKAAEARPDRRDRIADAKPINDGDQTLLLWALLDCGEAYADGAAEAMRKQIEAIGSDDIAKLAEWRGIEEVLVHASAAMNSLAGILMGDRKGILRKIKGEYESWEEEKARK